MAPSRFMAPKAVELPDRDPDKYFHKIRKFASGSQGETYFTLARSVAALQTRDLEQLTQQDWEAVRKDVQVLKVHRPANILKLRQLELNILNSDAVRATEHVGHLLAYSSDPERSWQSQQFVGAALGEHFDLFRKHNGLDPAQRNRLAWEILKQSVEIVDALQRGHLTSHVAHGDLVGQNICIAIAPAPKGKRRSKERWHIKLIDFGKGELIPHGVLPFQFLDARYDPAFLARTLHNAYHPIPYDDDSSNLPIADTHTKTFCWCYSEGWNYELPGSERTQLDDDCDRDFEELLERMAHPHDVHQFTASEVLDLCNTHWQHKFAGPCELPLEVRKELDMLPTHGDIKEAMLRLREEEKTGSKRKRGREEEDASSEASGGQGMPPVATKQVRR